MNIRTAHTIVPLCLATALTLSACGATGPVPTYATNAKIDCAGKQNLTASGSTAQANAMTHFIKSYQDACPGRTLTYTSNGSGAGVSEFIAGKTDFGGSDSPLQGDEYASAKARCNGDAWNLPVIFGPLAVTFNLKDVNVLILDAPTIAKIFTGAITRWNDPAITALNDTMPAEDIHVVYRSDASGTTDNFQQYLQAASQGAWNRGAGKVFHGGVGQSAPGNEGTSALVAKTEGTISYNEWSYALNRNMAAADIRTPAGIVHIGDDWIGTTLSDAKITGQGGNTLVDLSAIYNTTKKNVYPIMLASYELVCSKNPDTQVGQAVKAFLQSTTTVGQTDLTKSGYIPLPPDFQSKVASAVNNLA